MTNKLTMLLDIVPPMVPAGAEVMTITNDLPPGDPGAAPHRHSGPVFGYMLEGEILFELEGEDPYVIKAGEAFWEPGGDVIHYQAANNLPNQPSKFVAVMIGVPGEPMLTFVDAEELESRRDRRGAPRGTGQGTAAAAGAGTAGSGAGAGTRADVGSDVGSDAGTGTGAGAGAGAGTGSSYGYGYGAGAGAGIDPEGAGR